MKLEMAKNSLFAILLRSSWWISFAIAAAIVAVSFAALPAAYAPYGAFGATPFVVIAVVAAWRQARTPSAKRVGETLGAIRAMSWKDFSAAVERGFAAEGYTVRRLGGGSADFELDRDSRITLVGCKRWKVARTGVEPLRDLHEAADARGAADSIYIAASEITEQARSFAAQKRIRLLHGAELARFLPVPRAGASR